MGEISNNENMSVCAKCGGKCCKSLPGCCLPEDILSSNGYVDLIDYKADLFIKIVNLIKEGNYQIDYWEGFVYEEIDGGNGYYIRPSTKGTATRVVNASWGGECVFFEEGEGCSLSFENRPYECRNLVPGIDGGECLPENEYFDTREQYAIAWYPYFNEIEHVISYFENEQYED